MYKRVKKVNKPLKGEIIIPSDKSISHRAVMFSSLAKGSAIIKNFSLGKDTLTTLNICHSLGLAYKQDVTTLHIKSDGILKNQNAELFCGNSGTTMRLMAGVLAGQNFNSVLSGDESLSMRPMKRVIEPLTLMGAKIESINGKAPLKIYGSELNSVDYTSMLASAQVKSSILLAGMFASGITTYIEPYISRNHTELMLSYLGANIVCDDKTTQIQKSELELKDIIIPGDISSAAYFIAASLIVPDSEIIIKNVGLNPTRVGIIDVVKLMGGNIEILNTEIISNELVGDIKITYSNFNGCEISGDMIPKIIDEIPIIALLATQARGTTTIKDAQDLRNKESDRLSAIVNELRNLGANIVETEDGMIINGKCSLKGDTLLNSYKDHRIAMTLYVAGLICEKEITISDFEWINISFPEFEKLFEICMK